MSWAMRNHNIFSPLMKPSVDVCVSVQTCASPSDAMLEHVVLHHAAQVFVPCDKNFSVHWFFAARVCGADTLEIERPL
eukprot:11171579-Lingulodinium_polyedra.AAC.1